MKKVILASVLTVAAVSGMQNVQAANTEVCAGGTGASFSWVSVTGAFVQSGFSGRCSKNVFLYGDDNTTFFRVGAASGKGKQAFGGSTAGGGITGTNCSSATLCVTGDAAAAATNAASS